MLYKPFLENSSSTNVVKIEELILKFWKKNNIFQESVNQRSRTIKGKSNEFIFYDGPPFANGLPHYGHLLTGFIKDTYARYQTIKGKRVERVFGWDCHGLPAELGAEKDLQISGRKDIINFGIEKFNSYCKKSVMLYANQWRIYVQRQARWVDFDNSYKTMDMNFMESVLWAFKSLYDKGLVYQDLRVMPYSWACETPLSNFETKLDNSYRPREDKTVTVSFLLKNVSERLRGLFEKNIASYKILVWTTTPWTLPSNLALGVGKDIKYVCITVRDTCYILAKSSLKFYYKELGIELKNISSYPCILGQDLQGMSYSPLFSYFINHKNAFRVILCDFVIEGEGTGIIHMAPGFGEEDREACKKNSIDIVCPVDSKGKFTEQVSDYFGVHVFDSNALIINYLKNQGYLIKQENYIHNYPHCWRTDTALIYKAVPSWYIKVTQIRDRMVELNKQINWIPPHIKDGLFGKWIQNAKDWSISRNRFWGTPIPIWISNDPKYPRIDVYGSVADLEKDFNTKIVDLHREFLDKLTRKNPNDPTGKSYMIRIEDVFDCWFESGSMPYAQVHYPFENKEWFLNHFPADFIVEYSAQTRGWFYTLMVLSTALFDKPPFLNAICHGVILDINGLKLSKRLNNYLDPTEIFDKYGADSLRAMMLSSNVVKGEELLIDKEGKVIFEKLRNFINPILSSYNFFSLYANLDKISPEFRFDSSNLLDRYIISQLKLTVLEISHNLDIFDTYSAYHSLYHFVDVLNNWYIRRSRDRFWKNIHDKDKYQAYNTLYSCLLVFVSSISPLLPMVSEYIYLNLKKIDIVESESNLVSVHLIDFPSLDFITLDHDLIRFMNLILDICTVSLALRNKHNIRIRQPLVSLTIVMQDQNLLSQIKNFEYLIKDEINVKSVIYVSQVQNYVKYKLSINYSVLAKRIPHKIKDIVKDVELNKWTLHTNGSVMISGQLLREYEFVMSILPQNNNAFVLNHHQGLIMLDTDISQELFEEGLARDLIRIIQNIRKDLGFKVSDRIDIYIDTLGEKLLENIISSYKDFIVKQTLTNFIKNDYFSYSRNVILDKKNIIIYVN